MTQTTESRIATGYLSEAPEYFILEKKEWQVTLDYYETKHGMSGEPILLIHFRVAETGKFFQYPLIRYYKVDCLKGKPQRNGSFKAKKTGSFIVDFSNVTYQTPKRLDRIPMSILEKIPIVVSVRTKKKYTDGNKHLELPNALHYSVVDRMLRKYTP